MRGAVDELPDATLRGRMERLASALGDVRLLARTLGDVRLAADADGLLPDQPQSDNDAPVHTPQAVGSALRAPGIGQIEKILGGAIGVKPQRAFELGEAAYRAGVGWVTGLHALAWAPEFRPHAIGVVGRCLIDCADFAHLAALWPVFRHIASGSNDGERDCVLPRGAHLILLAAWQRWANTHEDPSDLPAAIAAYLAMAHVLAAPRLPVLTPAAAKEYDRLAAATETAARSAIEDYLVRLDLDDPANSAPDDERTAFWQAVMTRWESYLRERPNLMTNTL